MSNIRPIATTMRYVAAREAGPPEVLGVVEGPVPQPQAGEVLIDVNYAGVNRPDCAQRAGTYPPPPGASKIIGLEVAGTIVACGDGVTSWRIGDTVCALTPGGGYAEYCTTPAVCCLPIPKGLSLLEAASLLKTISPSGTTSSTADTSRAARRSCARRLERHRPHRDPARQAIRRDRVHDGRQRRQGSLLPLARRAARDQLPHAGFRRRDRADHRQERCRPRARHGRRRLHREEPPLPRAGDASSSSRSCTGARSKSSGGTS